MTIVNRKDICTETQRERIKPIYKLGLVERGDEEQRFSYFLRLRTYSQYEMRNDLEQ